MTRKEIEKYLGKKVEIKLFDGTIVKGEFHKTREKEYENDPNLYIPKNYYFVDKPHNNLIFRSSHIRKIRDLKEYALYKGDDFLIVGTLEEIMQAAFIPSNFVLLLKNWKSKYNRILKIGYELIELEEE